MQSNSTSNLKADSGFNKVARFYDLLARLIFGKKLQQAQLAFLDFIPPGASVLIIGGGTGWILQQVVLQGRSREILYLEASAKMLAITSRKFLSNQPSGIKPQLRLGTEKNLGPGETFDIIITPFLLDLFAGPRLAELTGELEKRLNPGGRWLIADFRFATDQPFWQKALLRAMYGFFRLICQIGAKTLANWDEELQSRGLKKIKSALFYNQMIESAVYQKPGTAAAEKTNS